MKYSLFLLLISALALGVFAGSQAACLYDESGGHPFGDSKCNTPNYYWSDSAHNVG